MVKKSVSGLFFLSLLVIFGILAAGCIGAKETPAPTTTAAPTTQPPMTTPPPPTTAPPTPPPTTAAPVVTAPPAPKNPVAIAVLDYPKASIRDDYHAVTWKVTGGDVGKIDETRVVWALASVKNVSNLSSYNYRGKIYKGQTPVTYIGEFRTPNCGTGLVFFRVYAKVDGKEYFSNEYKVDGYPWFGHATVESCPKVIDLEKGILGTGPVWTEPPAK